MHLRYRGFVSLENGLFMSARAVRWPLCFTVAAVLLFLLAGCGSGGSGKKSSKKNAVPDKVLTLKRQAVAMNKSYPALLRSKQQVEVVARVNGFLEKREFKEGERVHKGQKLFTIEPAPYKAQLEQKQADLASAQANENNAQRNWKRISTLYKRKVASRAKRDDAKAKLQTAKASVQQARAAVDQAKIQMNYTQVNAPVTGMIGLRQVNVGNLVQASEKLVTITPLDPIEARFSMPIAEATALRLQRMDKKAPSVVAELKKPLGKKLKGKVTFLGSTVNRQTSQVQARATFDNPKALFMPGEYVSVKLVHLELPHLLTVPQAAVAQGQEGSQLYVLNKDNVAKPQNVSLGTQVGDWIVVTKGVKAGDRVVVNHIASVNAGAKIKPRAAETSPPGAVRQNAHSGTRDKDREDRDSTAETG
jgi:membrane fusion protein (multidrug efflux system)